MDFTFIKRNPSNIDNVNTVLKNLINYEWKKDFIQKIIPENNKEYKIEFFEDKYTLEERIEKFNRIRDIYKSTVPIILQPSKGFNPEFVFTKTKFLLPNKMLLKNFFYIIQSKSPINKSLFFFVIKNYKKEFLTNRNLSLEYLYELYKGDDGFMYVYYIEENCFG